MLKQKKTFEESYIQLLSRATCQLFRYKHSPCFLSFDMDYIFANDNVKEDSASASQGPRL